MAVTAKIAALKFLKLRPRSTGEIEAKLKLKGFSYADIAATIQELTASGLLDDRAFTRSWISYRLARPFGFRRIIKELENKGIDQDLITQVMGEIKAEYNPEDAARDLAQRRWQHMPEIAEQKKKKRIMDFLLRRGFEVNVVMKVLKQLT